MRVVAPGALGYSQGVPGVCAPGAPSAPRVILGDLGAAGCAWVLLGAPGW